VSLSGESSVEEKRFSVSTSYICSLVIGIFGENWLLHLLSMVEVHPAVQSNLHGTSPTRASLPTHYQRVKRHLSWGKTPDI
jgi:hypothetical protein